MSNTVRETILVWLYDHFQSMVAGSPVGDPYTVTWSLVTRAPLGDRADKKKFAIGIFDVQESKTARVGYYDCVLRVVLEFRVWVEGDGDPSVFGNLVLGEVQRRVREDTSLGRNAIDCKEVGNELDVDGPNDHQVRGVVFLNISYRHHENDPRRRV